MNITKFFAMAVVALLAFATVSCSKDDEPEVPETIKKAVGRINTKITSSVPVMNFGTDCGTGEVKIVAKTDSTVDIILPKFAVDGEASFNGGVMPLKYQLGSMTIKDVTVHAQEPYASVFGIRLLKGSFTAQAGDFEIHGVEVNGTYKYPNFKLDITFRPGNMPQMLYVVTSFVGQGAIE